jgi:3-hydroxyacyl-[acyl-carrier-protein] dehydratase
MILSEALKAATRTFSNTTDSAEATLHFSGEEFFFEGHFPKNPIVPAVVQIDIALHLASRALGRELRLREVTRAIFKRPVGPGQELAFSISWGQAENELLRLKCNVQSAGQSVAEFSLRVS